MKVLLRKDRPWSVALLVAGTIALAAAIGERGGFEAFVVGAWRLEALFHTAWICGLVAGLVAACFDEVLGTREYLRQRAVSARTLLTARLAGLAIVVGGWLLLAPLGAWLWFAALYDGAGFTRAGALATVLVTMLPALSGAAIGFAAGSLPVVWWLRLLAAAAWFLPGYAGIWQLSTTASGTSVGAFVLGHVVLAALALALAVVAAGHSADPDRPWPQRLRVLAAGSAALGVVLMWAAFARETQQTVLRSLHRAYPQVVRLGEAVELGLQRDDGTYALTDAEHVPTGAVRTANDVEARWGGSPQVARQFEFDAPRWLGSQSTLVRSMGGEVWLAGDGTCWLRSWRDGVRRLGKGEAAVAFDAGSRLSRLGTTVVVLEPEARRLWRCEGSNARFVPLPFPSDDVPERFQTTWLHHEQDAELRQRLDSVMDGGNSVEFVQGRRGGYVLRDGALVLVPGLGEKAASEPAGGSSVETADPIAFPIEVPYADGRPPFHHEFTPRTGWERVCAGAAMLWSLLRPPVVQVVAHVRTSQPWLACWFDVLVIDGRRTWLVLAGFAFAGLVAFRVARRLRCLGAPAPVVQFWIVTTVLLGPIAGVLSVVCERPRAFARRALPGPFPAPRITTATSLGETVA